MSASKTPSPAQVAANRRNAQLSTGPRTEEGKATSRGNALKHGLSSLVVVPGEEQGHVAARVEWLQDSLAPDDDPLTLLLARQFAFLSVQLERGYRYDEAMVADRARNAQDDFDDARWTAAEQHFSYIGAEPVTHHRRLMRSIEGVDLLIVKMEDLRRVGQPGHGVWTEDHGMTFDLCTGRHSGTLPQSRCSALSAFIERNDARGLDPAEVAGMDHPTGYAWAVAEAHKLVDAELDRLRAHRATLDPAKHAVSHAQAPSRALFGIEKEMQLYRRYQGAASRALLKLNDQIRRRRRDLDHHAGLTLSPPEMSAAQIEARRIPDVTAAGPAMASFCNLLGSSARTDRRIEVDCWQAADHPQNRPQAAPLHPVTRPHPSI